MLSLKYALKVMQFLHQDLPPMSQDDYTPFTNEQLAAMVGRVIVPWPSLGYPHTDAYGRQKTKPDEYMLVLGCMLDANEALTYIRVAGGDDRTGLHRISRDVLLNHYRVVVNDSFERCGNPPA